MAKRVRNALVVATLLGGVSVTLGACYQSDLGEQCVSTEDYFKSEVWAPIMSQQCITCHSTTGAAKDSEFILQSSDWPGYLEANLAVVERMAKLEFEGTPWLIAKPTALVEHGGGEQFERDSDKYDTFVKMVELIKEPVTCDNSIDDEQYWDGVAMLSDVQTLRKATLNLVGRLPTPDEEQRVRDGGLEALDVVLDEVLQEEAFYPRLGEMWNDLFLTDKYLPNEDAVDLLQAGAGDDYGQDYPDAKWYENLPEGEQDAARRASNRAVARENLALIEHIVREGKPFREVITADYMMVNPYSAKSYGLGTNFDDNNDENEWKEAKIPGVPHAGVLTSTVWLTRFPTTDTNRNRHRSRMVYKFFLATDILALAERPIDPTTIETFNPTRESEQCTVCHTALDPAGGAMQNWDVYGKYRPPENGWYQEMFAPGFGDAELPPDRQGDATAWLAEQIVEDTRFSTSIVNVVYEGITGQEPLREPTDPDSPGYLGRLRAFDIQVAVFQDIAAKFVESDHDFRVVVKEIVRSPYFRASHFEGEELGEDRYWELANVVTAEYLTPEALNRKITAITGYPWVESPDDDNYLLDFDEYRIFYGGIDSDTITTRITSPNGIMSNVADRMSNEVACWNTARDFVESAANRRLFPYVEPGFEPEDQNGFEIPATTEAIRRNIQYLHAQLLGEYLPMDDSEIDRTYKLFLEVWRDGKKGVQDGTYSGQLPGECQADRDFWTQEELGDAVRIENDPNYTIRAWMAVMTYMLSDYKFLHE